MCLGLGKKGRELLHQNLAMGAEVAKFDHQNANFTWENRDALWWFDIAVENGFNMEDL